MDALVTLLLARQAVSIIARDDEHLERIQDDVDCIRPYDKHGRD